MIAESRLTVGILGHYGDFNLGDEATIEAIIAEARQASIEVICISANPDDSWRRHGVEAFPVHPISNQVRQKIGLRERNLDIAPEVPTAIDGRSFLRERLKRFPGLVTFVKSLRAIRDAVKGAAVESLFLISAFRQMRRIDLLLIAGSNQLFDYIDGPWYFPFNLLRWSILTRLAGKKLAYVGVGAGPIDAGMSKFMLRQALALAHYRSYRDPGSKRLVESIHAGEVDDPIVPDLAFSLRKEPAETSAEASGSRHLNIAVNPMPLFDVRFRADGDPVRYAALVHKYVEFTNWLIDQDYNVIFYATHPKDVLVVDDILDRISDLRFVRSEDCFPKNVDRLMSVLGAVDIAVATRFHGILLPYTVGVPVLGIEYWPKSGELMTYMGQADYLVPESDFVNSSDPLNLGGMTAKFTRLVREYDTERTRLRIRLQEIRAQLTSQYDLLWQLGMSSDKRNKS